jgi:hypothetical protein
VALTLRTVCGLTTPEIARAFLDAEPTMGQRISRAKAKIAAAGIPFAVPEAEHWPERLDTVLTTIYLIFTTGYVAGPGRAARPVPRGRIPDAPDRPAAPRRCRDRGRAGDDAADRSPPGRADRAGWRQPAARRTGPRPVGRRALAEGRAILARAVARRRPGPFQIKAAIADCQMADPAPDWPQIAALYGALWRHEPTPVVSLNAAVAIAEAGDPARGWPSSKAWRPMADYQPWHAARAALLAMTGVLAGAVELLFPRVPIHALGDPDHRHILDPQFRHDPRHGRNLPRAAVDQHQIGPGGGLAVGVLLQQALEAAGQDLFHHAEIVAGGDLGPLDVELAILALLEPFGARPRSSRPPHRCP